MTLRAVFFDVGETLVDEERYWREVSRIAGVQPHVVWAALGKTIERGEEHWELWAHLGMERPAATVGVVYSDTDLYPDARPALAEVRASGVLVGVAGNQSSAMEEWARSARLPVDLVTSSASLGVRKPAPAFFERLAKLADARPAEVAYVGDRADNDVLPALAAGLVAFHLRRGPWGRLQETPEGAVAIDSLLEVPAHVGATSAVGA
ncbi:MAG TPA: HAD family hydrolase [Gaiella sp.]|nr:HAD family hydrolase [Gaiella sp.]